MKSNILIIHLLCICGMSCLCSSCQRTLTAAELEKYIQDAKNGTKKTYESGSFKAEIIYRPTDLMVQQELETSQISLENLRKKYKQYYYFVLNLQNENRDLLNSTSSDRSMFAGINEQLSFNMNEHVYSLDEHNDTSHIIDFAFPRLYEAARSTSVLLVFNATDFQTNHFKICLKDIAYIQGVIQFDFNKKDLKTIPSLK